MDNHLSVFYRGIIVWTILDLLYIYIIHVFFFIACEILSFPAAYGWVMKLGAKDENSCLMCVFLF